MPGGKGKTYGGKSSGGKTSAADGSKKQQSHSARAGLQVSCVGLVLRFCQRGFLFTWCLRFAVEEGVGGPEPLDASTNIIRPSTDLSHNRARLSPRPTARLRALLSATRWTESWRYRD